MFIKYVLRSSSELGETGDVGNRVSPEWYGAQQGPDSTDQTLALSLLETHQLNCDGSYVYKQWRSLSRGHPPEFDWSSY